MVKSKEQILTDATLAEIEEQAGRMRQELVGKVMEGQLNLKATAFG